MILPELSSRLTRSVKKLLLEETLKEITPTKFMEEVTSALLNADFPVSFVNEMKRKIQEVINLRDKSQDRTIYQIIFGDLCSILDPGKPAFIIQKENPEPSIVMFVGLQGVEITNTCAEYARYHEKKGFNPALMCADTDAFDNKFPVYGSCTPDLIIVDTSGHRHEQYSALFDEMRQLAEEMKPDVVLFVMDSNIGRQAAFDQAQAFNQSFPAAGVVIVTNINTNSKAGGALSAVAAAKCTMVLPETGEKNMEFEAFKVRPFVKRLLHHCEYTLREMIVNYEVQLGVRKTWLPPSARFKLQSGPKAFVLERSIKIMRSMTEEELDRPDVIKQMTVERLNEIAKGSNVQVKEVVKMLNAFKKMAKWSKCGTKVWDY